MGILIWREQIFLIAWDTPVVSFPKTYITGDPVLKSLISVLPSADKVQAAISKLSHPVFGVKDIGMPKKLRFHASFVQTFL